WGDKSSGLISASLWGVWCWTRSRKARSLQVQFCRPVVILMRTATPLGRSSETFAHRSRYQRKAMPIRGLSGVYRGSMGHLPVSLYKYYIYTNRPQGNGELWGTLAAANLDRHRHRDSNHRSNRCQWNPLTDGL